MSAIQNKHRSFGNGEVWGEDRGLGNNYKNGRQLIAKANTVDFLQVAKHYSLDLNQYNKKICCPFPFHNDDSPSFYYYPETNSFNCFGCKHGGGSVIFVSLLEDISGTEAATKLLSLFESEEIDPKSFVKSKEKQDLYLKFSTIIRTFLKNNKSEAALEFADSITQSFDVLTQKHTIDIDGLRLIINKLSSKIEGYECH